MIPPQIHPECSASMVLGTVYLGDYSHSLPPPNKHPSGFPFCKRTCFNRSITRTKSLLLLSLYPRSRFRGAVLRDNASRLRHGGRCGVITRCLMRPHIWIRRITVIIESGTPRGSVLRFCNFAEWVGALKFFNPQGVPHLYTSYPQVSPINTLPSLATLAHHLPSTSS